MASKRILCGYCGGDHPPCYQIRHTWLCPSCNLTFATVKAQKTHVASTHIDGDIGAPPQTGAST